MTSHESSQTIPNRAALIAQIRELFLDRLVKAVGVMEVAASGIEALRAAAAQGFDELTAEDTRSGFALANSLTASQIRLVDDNQLELSLRLGDLSRRLSDECWSGTHRFHQRFVTLIDRPVLRMADNPLAPEAVCRALAEMFGAGEMPHQQTLNALASIETQLERELPLLYADANELLVLNHVAPARSQIVTTESRPGAKRTTTDAEGGTGDAMAALQQAVLSRLQPDRRAPGGSVDVKAWAAAGGDVVAIGSLAPRLEQIMAHLDQWQVQGQSDLFGEEAANEPIGSPLLALKSSEEMGRLRAQDTVALDVLSTLFDAVFDDTRLSDSVKTAVARLQIPVLKAAIIGPTFFTDPEHPARALLTDMGRATIGLAPDADGSHPVCAELMRIAAGIQFEFHRDPEVFARYGAELESFMAHRNHDLQGSAQGFIALAKTREAHDIAARTAWRLVASRTAALPSRLIADFLREHWTEVLAADWLAGGEAGAAWHEDVSVLDDLLWSLESKSTLEERTHLGQLVPALLRSLKSSLDHVGVMAEVRAPFLDACFAVQAAAIRGKPVPVSPSPSANAGRDGRDKVVVLQADGLTLNAVCPADPDARVSSDHVRELVIGDWVEFAMPDGALRCGRLCWISPELGNTLFMNSAWDCAISVARPVIERQLASAQASTGSTLSFFDNAIEKALHQSIPAGT
jgi:hypothetical protein